jgi:nitroreductase
MELAEALYTTRAMRRVKPDPIPDDVQAKIMDAAIRAPSGGNSQSWKFLLVDDPAVKGKIGPLYRASLTDLWDSFYKDRIDAAEADLDSDDSKQMMRIKKSADWLADHFAEVPLFLFGFAQHDPTGGSIFPAIWSAQLAARGEGVGSALTSVLLFRNDEVFDILGVPKDDGWGMACCVSFGYPTGKWGVAARTPAHDVTYRNTWGAAPGFEIPDPLWP